MVIICMQLWITRMNAGETWQYFGCVRWTGWSNAGIQFIHSLSIITKLGYMRNVEMYRTSAFKIRQNLRCVSSHVFWQAGHVASAWRRNCSTYARVTLVETPVGTYHWGDRTTGVISTFPFYSGCCGLKLCPEISSLGRHFSESSSAALSKFRCRPWPFQFIIQYLSIYSTLWSVSF